MWTEGHIRAHFLTCYLALLIVRLSQRALPSHPSAQELLADMQPIAEAEGLGDRFQAFRANCDQRIADIAQQRLVE